MFRLESGIFKIDETFSKLNFLKVMVRLWPVSHRSGGPPMGSDQFWVEEIIFSVITPPEVDKTLKPVANLLEVYFYT